ncbi:S1 family peptidase [Rhodococcus sp. NPDC058521]|uniref:S1 family peptidase n=1 Tax=Rhodococcus sp. NPDC058521 TaxID=3346536 RepID=UPI0036558BAF
MLKRFAAVFAATAAIMCTFAVGTGSAAPGPAVLGGGSGIIVNDELLCSITTIGHDNSGALVGLTAGHCGDAGATVVPEYQPDSGVVGRIVKSNPDYDYAVIAFDPAKVTPVNRVGNVSIASVGDPAWFPQIACKEGRTTGNTCGIVYGDILQSQETWTQACVVEGDSGAPLVVGDTLVAMVNAYLGFACIGPEIGTNISSIMNDMNASGGPGAGFRPI